MNLSESISKHSKIKPNYPAIIFESTSISYLQLDKLINHAAYLIKSEGLSQGDLVGICLPDTVEHVIAFYALIRSGVAILPMDIRWPIEERKNIISAFSPKLLLMDDDLNYNLKTIIINEDWLKKLIPSSSLNYNNETNTNGSSNLVLSLSTGTTGIPNGPMLTHSQMEARFITQKKSLYFGEDDIFLAATPFYFGAGRSFLMGMIHNGCTVVLMKKPYTAEELVNYIIDYSINVCLLVPTILRKLLKEKDIEKKLNNKLRLLLSTGSILHSNERKEVMEKICPNLLNYYGSTEGGGVSVLTWDDPFDKSGSVGKTVYGTVLEIVDNEGNLINDNNIGRIRYKGPSVARSFFIESEKSSSYFENGWFYPGDIGYYDSDGYLYLSGRTKDLIIRSGINIYPAEIENILISHPMVNDVAIVPWPSRIRGEEIAAFIIPNDKYSFKKNEIIEYCSQKISKYKIPRDIFLLNEFPKNSVGKILKNKLTAMLKVIEE